MLYDRHEALRWNRALWIYFAWTEMADVWPAGLFRVFLIFFSRLFCLASPESCYVFGQLSSYLLLHSNGHRPLLMTQPCLVCRAPSPPRNRLFSIPSPSFNSHILSLTWTSSPKNIPIIHLSPYPDRHLRKSHHLFLLTGDQCGQNLTVSHWKKYYIIVFITAKVICSIIRYCSSTWTIKIKCSI